MKLNYLVDSKGIQIDAQGSATATIKPTTMLQWICPILTFPGMVVEMEKNKTVPLGSTSADRNVVWTCFSASFDF